MADDSLALTPTWSVATVLTIFVAVSLLVERSIHRLSSWLRKTKRKPLLQALEKMKEELMLLGFISLLLTATSNTIADICISSEFYSGTFAPCTKSEIDAEEEENSSWGRRLLTFSFLPHPFRRKLTELNQNTCKKGKEPFVSNEGLEQLHRFIFVMAVTHISYSCLTMLLAIMKVRSWRTWEDDAAHRNHPASSAGGAVQRQSTFVRFHTSNALARNSFMVWVVCFFSQFGHSVVHSDYLTLRSGFIMNHSLPGKFDFHNYMIHSMEDEFQKIVGVSGPLWGFVVAFMLFNIKGSNLYFWIAIIPMALLLVVGTKLQHVIKTLALETSQMSGPLAGMKFSPRDSLFWFKKPELLLSLIHFILFQNAFELASFFWFWWQFGFNSCFIRKHLLLYTRLILGFIGQFLCSYSTLPLYALVTQMGTNYKAALIPEGIRETIHGWGKAARRRRRHGFIIDDSTVHTEASTAMLSEANDLKAVADEMELSAASPPWSSAVMEFSSRSGAPLLRASASISSSSSSPSFALMDGMAPVLTPATLRSHSMPIRRA